MSTKNPVRLRTCGVFCWLAKWILPLLLAVLLLEGVLRLQQRIHPFISLDFSNANPAALSPVLNHVNLAYSTHFYKGRPYVKRFDENGIRKDVTQPDLSGDTQAFRILCMGDSFMEGFDDTHTLPYVIRHYFSSTPLKNKPLYFLNAGTSSYSPAIFIPQAKKLIPLLKPDFVLIDIDESDLGDDAFRYKKLIVRDQAGKIIAVREAPVLRLYIDGLARIQKQPLYVTRLVSKLYLRWIYVPWYSRHSDVDKKPTSYVPTLDVEAGPDKYAAAISFFEENLSELAETLIREMGSSDRILFVYHPLLGQIKADAKGYFWHHFVSDSLRKVCSRYRVAFYDATEDFKARAGNDLQAYYLPNDTHFTYEGLEIYGECVATRMEGMLEPLVNKKGGL